MGLVVTAKPRSSPGKQVETNQHLLQREKVQNAVSCNTTVKPINFYCKAKAFKTPCPATQAYRHVRHLVVVGVL